jgi:hypothetical protein
VPLIWIQFTLFTLDCSWLHLLSSFPYVIEHFFPSTLKMEARVSSKILVNIYQTGQCHFLEDNNHYDISIESSLCMISGCQYQSSSRLMIFLLCFHFYLNPIDSVSFQLIYLPSAQNCTIILYSVNSKHVFNFCISKVLQNMSVM